MKNQKKRAFKLNMISVLLQFGLALFAINIALKVYNTYQIRAIESKNAQIKQLQKQASESKNKISFSNPETLATVHDAKKYEASKTSSTQKRNVIFSNYGAWDESSKGVPASGVTFDMLAPNQHGYLMLNGFVGVAAATKDLENEGFTLKDGHRYFKLGEKLEIEIKGKKYKAIVLDACGACMGLSDEDAQRIDVMTTSNSIGLAKGYIYGI